MKALKQVDEIIKRGVPREDTKVPYDIQNESHQKYLQAAVENVLKTAKECINAKEFGNIHSRKGNVRFNAALLAVDILDPKQAKIFRQQAETSNTLRFADDKKKGRTEISYDDLINKERVKINHRYGNERQRVHNKAVQVDDMQLNNG